MVVSFSTFKLRLLVAGSLSFITYTSAANDWNTPCFDEWVWDNANLGFTQCDIRHNNRGWLAGKFLYLKFYLWNLNDRRQILNCSATALAQDIRIMCMSNDTTAAGCDNLFQGSSGAEGKLVRLPENCGQSAFARVAKSYVPDDQTIPANISARFVRRDGNGTLPQVHALSLDTNFSAIDSSTYGVVNIAIQGANFPGADVNGSLVSTSSRRSSRIASRSLSGFVGNAINSIKGLNNVNVNKTDVLPPISVDKSATLLNKDIKCGNEDITLDIGVDGKANALVSVGLAAQGTIVPPDLSDFAITVSMNADIDGSLDLNAGASTTFDTGEIQIIPPIGLPGLDFPGILTLGPSFDVSVEATASLNLAADLNVGIVYNVTNVSFDFPDNSNGSSGDFNPGNTPLSLSLTPSVQSTGSVTAHLIPSLNFGIQVLDNVASATVFVDLHASATMQLSLDASDTITVSPSNSTSTDSTGTSSNSTNTDSSSSNSTSTSYGNSNSTNYGSTYSAGSSYKVKRNVAAAPKPTSVAQAVRFAKRAAASNASASNTSSSDSSSSSSGSSGDSIASSSTGVQFSGCIEIDTGIAANVGAEGSFFKLFDASTQVPLFNKEFVLFQKCFGGANATSTRRSLPPVFKSRAAAAAEAPLASNSTASFAASCLASSSGLEAVATNIQIGSAIVTVKPA
ncbi:hypothetical protein BDP27DRAFT_1420414 [Rhodocollybia butyracea]|uniref:Uncharacterized protein n=1 Tax=Rhodocollybia butyracea TaxID=206335 RepID=A0A9P5U8F7_9AGAR|nr:hypothetical protein BDP27DRAFT_1420414 [Rhodocollybia butyracea]